MSEQGPLTIRVQVRYKEPIAHAMRLIVSEAAYLRDGDKKTLVNGTTVEARIVYEEDLPPGFYDTRALTHEETARGEALAAEMTASSPAGKRIVTKCINCAGTGLAGYDDAGLAPRPCPGCNGTKVCSFSAPKSRASVMRSVYLHMTDAMKTLDGTGDVEDERIADGLRDLMDVVWRRLGTEAAVQP